MLQMTLYSNKQHVTENVCTSNKHVTEDVCTNKKYVTEDVCVVTSMLQRTFLQVTNKCY